MPDDGMPPLLARVRSDTASVPSTASALRQSRDRQPQNVIRKFLDLFVTSRRYHDSQLIALEQIETESQSLLQPGVEMDPPSPEKPGKGRLHDEDDDEPAPGRRGRVFAACACILGNETAERLAYCELLREICYTLSHIHTIQRVCAESNYSRNRPRLLPWTLQAGPESLSMARCGKEQSQQCE